MPWVRLTLTGNVEFTVADKASAVRAKDAVVCTQARSGSPLFVPLLLAFMDAAEFAGDRAAASPNPTRRGEA